MEARKTKKRMGRPPKPPGEKYSEIVTVKMTKAERRRIKAEMKRTGLSLSGVLMRPWRKEARD